MITNRKLQPNLNRVAKELNLSKNIVTMVCGLYWRFVKEDIESHNLKDIEEREFNELNPAISLTNIGKITIEHKKVLTINNYRNERNKSQKD